MAASTIRSFLWHDYETFGADPRRDRPAQFAALRTDPELNPVGEPMVIFCQAADDMLPHPDACMITGITPQLARKKGCTEAEFARLIRATMMEPGTCVAGYNSIRFDDEFTRNLLYRNLYDPYEREYSNGNSRWDIIDLARACYALRPEGLSWPLHDNGKPSFKLEDLSRSNNIEHGAAHDALSDVRATLGLAARLRTAQPRLFEYALLLRDKDHVATLIDPLAGKPFVHTSARIPAERGCTTVMFPVCRHPANPKAVICADLNTDIEDLVHLPADEIGDRLFTPTADLPEGVARISVKTIASNKVPFVAPLNVLKNIDLERIGLDLPRCLENANRLASAAGVAEKLAGLFGPYADGGDADPDLQIYSGAFFSTHDKRTLQEIHACRPEALATQHFSFADQRLDEMLFRYRARNYPDTLGSEEAERWQSYRRQRLLHGDSDGFLTLADYHVILAAWRDRADLQQQQIDLLDELAAWPLEIGIANAENTA